MITKVAKVHEKNTNHKCDLCEYSAFDHSGLRKHIESVHEKLRRYCVMSALICLLIRVI